MLTERLAYILSVDASGAVGFDRASVAAKRYAENQLAAAAAADKLAVEEARKAVALARATKDTEALARAQANLSAASARYASSRADVRIAGAQGELAAAERSAGGGPGGIGGLVGGLFSGLGGGGGMGAALGSAAGPAAAGAAVAAAGLAVKKFTQDGVQQFAALGEAVDRYQDLAGGTAEQASKMVVTFRDLGVDTEAGAKSMAFLGREVDSGGKNLSKFGIQVDRNRDGTVDLNKTLLNVADAYNRTGDQAQKDAILMAAFGRQGIALTDVLEQGRDGLQKFWQQAENHGEVLSEKDREEAVQFDRSIKDLQESFKGLEIQAGKTVVPLLTAFARGTTALVDFGNHVNIIERLLQSFGGGPIAAGLDWLTGRIKNVGDTAQNTAGQIRNAADEINAEMDTLRGAETAVQSYQRAMDGVAKAHKAVEEAAGAQARKEKDIAAAVRDSQRANEDLAKAQDNLNRARREAPRDIEKAKVAEKSARDAVLRAEDDLKIAIARYGVESREAAEATDKLAEARLGAADATDKANELDKNKAHPLAVQDAERAVADAKQRQADAAERKTKADQEDPVAEQAAATAQLADAERQRDDAWHKIRDEVDKVNAALGTQFTVQDAINGKLDAQLDKLRKIKDDAAAAAASVADIIKQIDSPQGQAVATVIAGKGAPAPPQQTGSGAVGTILQGQASTTVQVGPNTFINQTDPKQAADEIAWLLGTRGVT